MGAIKQAGRFLTATTPLGEDAALVRHFEGSEAISQLFSFKVELLAYKDTAVDFSKFLGKELTVAAAIAGVPGGGSGGEKRYFSGICCRLAQGGCDGTWASYEAFLVPKFWLLTKQSQSRIYQHKTVPDILKDVLKNLDVEYSITGAFEPREYCVQYRETDFAFACRLMEEEGIYYYFKHSESGHKMVVGNSSLACQNVPGKADVEYELSKDQSLLKARVTGWRKMQELKTGKHTLWDYSFELPGNHLNAAKAITGSATAGPVAHQQSLPENQSLEVYDFPGGYAKRFDGIDQSGGEQPSNLQKIFQDNTRTVGLRMEAETAGSLVVEGESACVQFTSGFKFTLEKHVNADGAYLITAVKHKATDASTIVAGQSAGPNSAPTYSNEFTCIPASVPFRPEPITPKPSVNGVQTAIVVGPAGEEIFTDKYGRVKVQFPWDRQGSNDANSSCWLRVSTSWAGKQWGMIQIPRLGQEVVVDFVDGDPDTPIVVGSVFNPSTMPPYKLPDKKTISTIKSRSSLNGTQDNYNEIRFEDKKGSEQLFINAERDFDMIVEADRHEFVGKNHMVKVKKDRKESIEGKLHVHIKGDHAAKFDGKHGLNVGTDREAKIGQKEAVDAGTEIHLKAGTTVVLEAGVQLSLKVGSNFIDIGPAGISIQGTMVNINSGGSPASGGGASPDDPDDPETQVVETQGGGV